MAEKAKYWTAVLYPESMVEGWQEKISDLLQVPFAYCIHDKDTVKAIKAFKNKYGKDVVYEWTEEHDERKVHLHIIIAFSNTTTYKHALSIFKLLSSSCNYCQKVINVRYMFEYLIHNTETARKQKKHLYDVSERVLGNNFDIGMYEQRSLEDKRADAKQLKRYIMDNGIENTMELDLCLNSDPNIDDDLRERFEDALLSYSGYIGNTCKGVYLYHCKKYDSDQYYGHTS